MSKHLGEGPHFHRTASRGAGDHEGQGGASYLRAISGVVAGGNPPKFWAVGKSSSCQRFFVEKCEL